MRILHLECLREGSPLFAVRTTWSPLPALSISILIVTISLLAGQALVGAVCALWPLSSGACSVPDAAATVVFLLGMQVAMVLMTLAAASWGSVSLVDALALEASPKGRRGSVEAVCGGIALLGLYSALAYVAGFTDLVTDLRPFVDLLRSPVWALAILAIAIGAPVAEELLFRGFLLPALSRSRLRFPGAAALSTLGWTALHAGYSTAGIVEVFLAGLYFCWLLWRCGSLRVPLLCHVATNTVALLVVATLAWRT